MYYIIICIRHYTRLFVLLKFRIMMVNREVYFKCIGIGAQQKQWIIQMFALNRAHIYNNQYI